MKNSKHLINDHEDRAIFILTKIGLGEVIREFPRRNQHGATVHCITDTGVLLVKTPDKETIVTMFCLSSDRLFAYFAEIGERPPQYLINICKKNYKRAKDYS